MNFLVLCERAAIDDGWVVEYVLVLLDVFPVSECFEAGLGGVEQ
jgi:hypothetical protein